MPMADPPPDQHDRVYLHFFKPVASPCGGLVMTWDDAGFEDTEGLALLAEVYPSHCIATIWMGRDDAIRRPASRTQFRGELEHWSDSAMAAIELVAAHPACRFVEELTQEHMSAVFEGISGMESTRLWRLRTRGSDMSQAASKPPNRVAVPIHDT